MEKLLTIIIPTYNMEKYLPKCLDSLIIEKHLMSQLDIIVVNDGSKDSSSEIAHTYEKRFPDSITVIDKQNGNYGSCINAGLKVAKGKYIRVLDSDDSYENKNFQLFVEQLKNLDVDLVVTNFIKVDEDGKILHTEKYNLGNWERKTLDDYSGNTIAMHAITYNRKVFNGLDYHQTEGISYTDTEWNIIPMLNVESIIYLDLDVYKYLIGREGQTVEECIFIRRSHELILVIKKVLNKTCLNSKNNLKYINRYIWQLLILVYRNILLFGNSSQQEILREFDNTLKHNYNRYYKELDNYSLESISYKYVRHWRTSRLVSSILRKCIKVYHKLKYQLTIVGII